MRITIAGRLAECVLLAYRTPAESVAHLLPAGLELITLGEWAFWNVVACRLEAMRPPGFPRWMGRDCLQVGYRLYVRGRVAGEVLEGLYFVRTDVDDRATCLLGNRLTDFRFHAATIGFSVDEARVSVNVRDPAGGAGDAEILACPGESMLAPDSCFESYTQARQFFKYQPIALSTDRDGRRVRIAEVLRCETDWRESPLEVVRARLSLFERLAQNDVRLELATCVSPIDYRWRIGASPPSARYDPRG